MRVLHGVILCALVVSFATCSPKINTELAQTKDLSFDSRYDKYEGKVPSNRFCREIENYIPDTLHPEFTPFVHVRVNVHIMDQETGMHSFSEKDGREFVLAMINECNARLANNVQMSLPIGNSTPVLPTRYQLQLTGSPYDADDDGIYFHEDPDLYYYIHGRNTNRTDKTVIKKYQVQGDSAINIFLMPHHPDSVGRKGYKAVSTGISLSTGIKMAQRFKTKASVNRCAGLLNHEIGHAIGISHAWRASDGCDDTPKHDNCFYPTGEPPCDSIVSNNMMDYNHWQHALTPCQIGKIHRSFSNERSRIRKFLNPYWCSRDPSATITIRDSVVWNGAKDLPGDLIIADGATLSLGCRLSLPENATITIAPEGTLILNGAELHNACDQQWYGIEIQSSGKNSGRIEMQAPSKIEDVKNPVDSVGT